MNDPVLLSRDGGLAVVTLIRPDLMNTVALATARALHAAFATLDGDDSVRAVLFGARGEPHQSRAGRAPQQRRARDRRGAQAHPHRPGDGHHDKLPGLVREGPG